MLNALSELKKYQKIDINNINNTNNNNKNTNTNIDMFAMLAEDIKRISKNQFKMEQQLEDCFEEIEGITQMLNQELDLDHMEEEKYLFTGLRFWRGHPGCDSAGNVSRGA